LAINKEKWENYLYLVKFAYEIGVGIPPLKQVHSMFYMGTNVSTPFPFEYLFPR
jgi:hypothetical protein